MGSSPIKGTKSFNMGWFLLYWFVGVIVMAFCKYLLDGKLTVGHLLACLIAAIVWPMILLMFLYVEYEDVTIFDKYKRK